MYYGQNYGKETINREYKEFTFNHGGLQIDPDSAEDLVKDSKWIFNTMVDNSLNKYLNIYISKYTSAFLDENSSVDYGEFYIGIADNGFVHGIPYQGTLDLKIIKTEMNKIIKQLETNNSLNDSINIELIPVNYEHQKITKYNNMYKEYIKHRTKINKKIEEHNIKFTRWLFMHNKYRQKLVDIFNEPLTRSELKNYIMKKDPTSSVLNLISDDNYKLESKTHEEINELKNFPNEPYYWVCRFKDELIDIIKKHRPINNIKSEILTYLNPLSILMKLSSMIPWWMQNNDNMKLYVIKISFIKNHKNNMIYYYDHKRKNRYYRTINEDKPCCIPLHD